LYISQANRYCLGFVSPTHISRKEKGTYYQLNALSTKETAQKIGLSKFEVQIDDDDDDGSDLQ
jgi:hypothetical protein